MRSTQRNEPRRPQPPPRVGSATVTTKPTATQPNFSLTRPSTSRNREPMRDYIPPNPPIVPGSDSSQSSLEVNIVSQWRSSVLKFEVALRELTSVGTKVGPSTERIESVLDLYDSFTAASPHIASILKMFRLEFCRAIFKGLSSLPDRPELGAQAYFDQVDTVSKEAAVLQAELDAVESDSSIEQLKRQLSSKQSMISFYEHEIARLTKEGKRSSEELTRMGKDSESTSKQHHVAFSQLDEECNRLLKENRDLQLQVFKLGKDSREQAVGQGIYARLKQSKYETLQLMYDDGNEEAALLCLMYQLEALENESLEEYEAQLFKSTVAEMPSWRTKFIKGVQLLLEEYHSTDFRRCQLLRYAKGDEHVSSRLMQGTGQTSEALEGTHSQEQARLEQEASAVDESLSPRSGGGLHKRGSMLIPAVVESGGATADESASTLTQSPSITTALPRTAGQQSQASFPSAGSAPAAPATTVLDGGGDIFKARSRQLWSGRRFGDMYDRNLSSSDHLWNVSSPCFHQRVVAPLLDISSSKFMTALEIYATTPTEATLLRTINHIDPTSGIELPPRTSQVKLKYVNPLIRPAVIGEDEESDRPRELPDPSIWVVGDAESQEQKLEIKKMRQRLGKSEGKPGGSPTSPGAGTEAGAEEGPTPSGSIIVKEDGTVTNPTRAGPHWVYFKKRFGSYTPHLPRLMDIHHVDQLMLQIFIRHHVRLMHRFDACHETAAARSTGAQMARTLGERLFKEDYNALDMQNVMIEVLENRYIFPEVAMKVAHELLSSLEQHAGTYPYTRAYLDCIAQAQPSSLGFVLAINLHMLSTFWPLSPSQANDSISERDLLAVLKGVYPSESLLKINVEELAADILVACRKNITLNGVRQYLTTAILTQREPMLHKLLEMLLFKAGAVHWSELDINEFWDCVKSIMSEDFHTSAVIRHSYACNVCRKPTRLAPSVLANIAADLLWFNVSKSRFEGL